MRVYYGHCKSIYGTPQEERDLLTLRLLNPTGVTVNPAEHDSSLMSYYLNLVDSCDALVFRALPDGSIPAGVAKEIDAAHAQGIPVVELPVPITLRRVLTVNETRAYLALVGER